MTNLLLAFMLLLQGIPTSQQGGTITGVLQDDAGKPIPNVRVAAVEQAETPGAIREFGVLAGLTQTDAEGRYRLENIRPGRYYIAAGAVSVPTYYPGTLEVREGTVIAITAGTTISGVDFRVKVL